MLTTADLDQAIKAVCPIHGVAVNGQTVVRIDFKAEATEEHRAAAKAVVDEWDWDAEPTVRFVAPNVFYNLFTRDERRDIHASTDLDVKDFMGNLLTLRDDVDLQHPLTIGGVQYLQTLNLLTVERAARILSGKAPQ